MKETKQEAKEAEVERAIERIEALLTEDGVLIPSPKDVEGLSSRGYGISKGEGLLLSFYEALFLLSKRIVQVKDEKTGEPIDFQTLLNYSERVDENAWVRYLIYRDLRSRGYVAREGFGLGIDFRVYERGKYGKEAAKYLIFGIQEGKPVSVEELARGITYVQSLKKKLVLAVINRRGEVVYYSLSRLTLK